MRPGRIMTPRCAAGTTNATASMRALQHTYCTEEQARRAPVGRQVAEAPAPCRVEELH